MELPKPTQSELDNIMVFLRFDAIEKDYVPKSVKTARDVERAWRTEALRFWYLVVMPQRKLYGPRIITSPTDVDGYDISKYVDSARGET